MNAPFSWNAGIARMRCRTSSSLTVMPSAVGFGQRGALVDHLLQDLLFDAELLQQLVVHVGAVCRSSTPGAAPDRSAGTRRRDFASLDDGDGAARRQRCRRGSSRKFGMKKMTIATHTMARLHLSQFRWLAHPIEHRHLLFLGKP
mgnify:CR=1 FL=1